MRPSQLSLTTRHLLIGALMFLTLFVDATVAYLSIQKLARNGRLVSNSFETISRYERLELLSQEIETTGRGFLLTGDQRFLEPFESAIQESTRLASALTTAPLSTPLNGDSPEKALPIQQLRAAVVKRIEIARRGIAARRAGGLAAGQRFIQSGVGAAQTRQIQRLASQLRTQEREKLEARALESSESAQDATRTFWIASLANIGFLGLILVLLWRAGAQNARLRGAYNELKRAETLRDNLSAMLVHDLRTPLTSLLGPLELLENDALGPLDETQHEVVKISRQSGEKLLVMVNQLLDISKMEGNNFQISPSQIVVLPLLERAQATVRGLEMSGARILVARLEIESVRADENLLERVLVNLLGNALKFTPENGQITLEVLRQSKGSLWSVEDSGAGIPPQFHDKIFEKWGQAETRQNGRKFSSGLGLTFCKLAVEAHGGRIWVESEAGRGAKFFFFLPANPCAAGAERLD